MMKIALYAPYDLNKIGGVERFIRCFASCAAMNNEVHLFTSKPLNLEGVAIHELSEEAKGFDLVLTHAVYGKQGSLTGKVHLHTFHGTILGNLRVRPWLWLHPKFWKWLRMEMSSLKGKDGVIGVSEWALNEIRQMGFGGELRQIPSGGGLEGERFRYRKTSPASSNNAVKFLFCGRKEDKVKRFWMIQDGFQLARKKCPLNLELHVFGGNQQHGGEGEFFHGTIDFEEATQRLDEFDCQINASYYEGYSLSLSEGIFQGGLITFATPRGGNRHCLKEGETGYFFKNAQELSEKILQLCSNTQNLAKMKDNILSSHPVLSWESVVESTLDFAREKM